MNQKEIETFGHRLAECSRTKQQIDQPSVTFPDITYDEAYAIQEVMVQDLVRSGWTISGKKVGLTSEAMRTSGARSIPTSTSRTTVTPFISAASTMV